MWNWREGQGRVVPALSTAYLERMTSEEKVQIQGRAERKREDLLDRIAEYRELTKPAQRCHRPGESDGRHQ